MTRKTFAYAIVWIAAVAAAAGLDRSVANCSRATSLEQFFREHRLAAEILKAPGTYYFTAAVAALVCWRHRATWRAAIFVLLATAVSGVNGAIKWIVGRYRPFKPPDDSARLAPFEFHPFPDQGRNLCFPSGHACLAFATAAALGILWPRWRWAFYLGAVLVAFERVAENAHWLSDAIAAAALGVGGVHLVRQLLGEKLLAQPPRGFDVGYPAHASKPAE